MPLLVDELGVPEFCRQSAKRVARVGVMEPPEMGTRKNGNEDDRSHFRFIPFCSERAEKWL